MEQHVFLARHWNGRWARARWSIITAQTVAFITIIFTLLGRIIFTSIDVFDDFQHLVMKGINLFTCCNQSGKRPKSEFWDEGKLISIQSWHAKCYRQLTMYFVFECVTGRQNFRVNVFPIKLEFSISDWINYCYSDYSKICMEKSSF